MLKRVKSSQKIANDLPPDLKKLPQNFSYFPNPYRTTLAIKFWQNFA